MHGQHHIPGANRQLARLLIQGLRQRQAPCVQRDPACADRQLSGYRQELAVWFARIGALDCRRGTLPLLKR